MSLYRKILWSVWKWSVECVDSIVESMDISVERVDSIVECVKSVACIDPVI